jgi:hypothetical protein
MLHLLFFVHEPIEVKFKISVAWSMPLSIVLSTDIRFLIFYIYTLHTIVLHNIHLI